MLYPSTLLALDDGAHAALRLTRLLRIAGTLSSHVIGISPTRPAPGDGAGVLGLDALTRELGKEALRAKEREHLFETTCEGLKLPSHEVVEAPEELGRALVDVARFSDLVLLEQPDATKADHSARRAIVDDVLIHGCRPVLLIPHAGTFEKIGTRVLIGWDGSRECARAVADALPFLRHARSVHVINVDRLASDDEPVDSSRLEPVRAWLKRHEISAGIESSAAPAGVGDALLSRAFELGSDLLVMGAWGHSRLQERLLGGATRTALETSPLPVLFSH